ncbi:MAG: DUF1064 domain-containing protein [bacterium]
MKLEKYNKYHNKPVEVDGIRFASQKEANRYKELMLLKRAGEIKWIIPHPEYAVFAGVPDKPETHKRVFTYIADFKYMDKQGKIHVEDVKGVRTQVYKLKKRIIEALYHIKIEEV